MVKMIDSKIEQIFSKEPDVIYGYADISYSPFSKEYKRALVIAVPHEELVHDIVSILYVLSCRLYGLRKYIK